MVKKPYDSNELYGLAINGKKWLESWRKNLGAADAPFDNLPGLEAAKFAQFYQDITTGLKLSPDVLQPADAAKRAQDLADAVTFRVGAKKVCWTEFLIYLSSGGMPPQDIYKAPKPSDDKAFLNKLKQNLGIHKKRHTKKHFYNRK